MWINLNAFKIRISYIQSVEALHIVLNYYSLCLTSAPNMIYGNITFTFCKHIHDYILLFQLAVCLQVFEEHFSHGIFCGIEPPDTILSEGSTLSLHFHADILLRPDIIGFRAIFQQGSRPSKLLISMTYLI